VEDVWLKTVKEMLRLGNEEACIGMETKEKGKGKR